MEPFTLLDYLEWAQDPLQDCAGQPVIPASNFPSLATDISALDEVHKSAEEIEALFWLQSKGFTACGANLGDRFAEIGRAHV